MKDEEIYQNFCSAYDLLRENIESQIESSKNSHKSNSERAKYDAKVDKNRFMVKGKEENLLGFFKNKVKQYSEKIQEFIPEYSVTLTEYEATKIWDYFKESIQTNKHSIYIPHIIEKMEKIKGFLPDNMYEEYKTIKRNME